MLSSLTLDDSSGNAVTLHETTNRAVSRVTGLVGITSVRDSRRVRPTAHGAIDETRYEDGRIITVEGAVWSQNSQAAAYTEFRAITTAMLQTLDVGPAALKWTEGASGLSLQRMVKLASDIDPPIEEAAAELKYQVQFFAEDPRAYSQSLVTATGNSLSVASGGATFPRTFPVAFNPSGGGIAVFTNAGNRPTPPTLRIYGTCQDPQILLLGTSGKIALTGTIGAGDYLELNAAERTIKLNGATNRLNMLDAANTTWFELPANSSSSLQLIAASFDTSARLDVLARSAYA